MEHLPQKCNCAEAEETTSSCQRGAFLRIYVICNKMLQFCKKKYELIVSLEIDMSVIMHPRFLYVYSAYFLFYDGEDFE